MVIFLGAAQDPNRSDHPLWFQIQQFLREHPEISSKYTFKMMAGYLDSQPGLWATQGKPHGPVKINPAYGFWSWVDRLNPVPLLSFVQPGWFESGEFHCFHRYRGPVWLAMSEWTDHAALLPR
jgi:hypothetical protein